MGMSTFTASDITSCTFNDVSILEMVLKTVRLSACPPVRCERVATELRVTSSILGKHQMVSALQQYKKVTFFHLLQSKAC